MQFLFLDSNLFLQCRPIRELDWDRFAGLDEITLLIPSAVLSELDNHKSGGNTRRAQRARYSIKLLDALLNASDDKLIVRTTPSKVVVQFAPEVAGDTSKSNDDSIIFEVTELAHKHGNQVVGLITHDTNLKVKAKRKGLRFFSVPDEWLLPPEPDERDKRVKQLEEEVALLKTQVPTIEITVDGNRDIEIIAPKYEPLPADIIECFREAMIRRFPMKRDFSIIPSEHMLSMGIGALSRLREPPYWEIAKYQNEEYPDWKNRLSSRIEQFHSILRIKCGKAAIQLSISNVGTVPAEHLHVAISVSEGFILSDNKQYDDLLKLLLAPPKSPTPPQPREANIDRLRDLQSYVYRTAPRLPQIPVKHRRDEFYLKTKENNASKWVWTCENMRHGSTPKDFSFDIGVNAKTQVSGGRMTIEVSAENLPKATTKEFYIKVRDVPADTAAVVTEWLELDND